MLLSLPPLGTKGPFALADLKVWNAPRNRIQRYQS